MDALRRMIVRHREPLRNVLLVGAVGVPLLFAAAALGVQGSVRRFLLFYIAPFFVAFFPWVWVRVGRIEADRTGALAVDAVATVLGAVRFIGLLPVPFSGHMQFYVYAGLTTRSPRFLLLIAVLAAEATWYKLVVWRDPRSWALGIATGAALAAARLLINRTSPVPSTAP
ncbi:MAG TPA: hypothetical protein VFT45_09885 [Longimicrobium sp.]|nr:hypothetical protein [Longimicrobium sp.]